MLRLIPASLLLAWVCGGCAREAWPEAPPPHPSYHYPAGWIPARHPYPEPPRAAHAPRSGRGALGRHIPGGDGCLDWLARHGIAYRPADAKPGMTTPVRVTGPIGGIHYYTVDGPGVLCDCRLAVALHWVAPHLRELGVTAVRHSGAYVYRRTRSGRPSLHARGLAIDVHELVFAGRRLSVKDNYRTGLGDRCSPSGSPVNAVTCRLERAALFRELITPDDDRDHHDHLHLGVMAE